MVVVTTGCVQIQRQTHPLNQPYSITCQGTHLNQIPGHRNFPKGDGRQIRSLPVFRESCTPLIINAFIRLSPGTSNFHTLLASKYKLRGNFLPLLDYPTLQEQYPAHKHIKALSLDAFPFLNCNQYHSINTQIIIIIIISFWSNILYSSSY